MYMHIKIYHLNSTEQINTSQSIHITISFPWLLRFKKDHAWTPPPPKKKYKHQIKWQEKEISRSPDQVHQRRRSTSPPATDLVGVVVLVVGGGDFWSRTVRRSLITSDFSFTNNDSRRLKQTNKVLYKKDKKIVLFI